MTHFICTGDCEGIADEPGTCKAESCARHGKELQECDCEDGTHAAEDADMVEESDV